MGAEAVVTARDAAEVGEALMEAEVGEAGDGEVAAPILTPTLSPALTPKVAKTGRGTLSSRDLTSGTRHGAVSASSNGASNGVSGLHNGPCKVSPTHRAPDAAPRRVTAKAVKPKALGVGAGVGVGVAAGVGVETPTPTPTLNPNP